jgi:hypothetical protein
MVNQFGILGTELRSTQLCHAVSIFAVAWIVISEKLNTLNLFRQLQRSLRDDMADNETININILIIIIIMHSHAK